MVFAGGRDATLFISTLSMFLLKLHHCIQFYFLKTENNEKKLARTPPTSICEQFDTCFWRISKRSSFKQALHQDSQQQCCSVEIVTAPNTTSTLGLSSAFLTFEWLCSWFLFHCIPALKVLGNMTLNKTDTKKKIIKKIYCFELVSSQKKEIHPNMSYRRTHQLCTAAS